MSLDAYSQAEDKQRTKDDLGKPDEINQLAFFDQQEDIRVNFGTLKFQKRDISSDTIWGNTLTWGTSNWDGTYNNSLITTYVLNTRNKFNENFLDTEFKDTTNTTATWDGSGTLTFGTNQDAVSLEIYKGINTINKVTLIATTTSTTAMYYVKTSSAGTWQEITPSVETILTTGGTELYFKINDANTTIDKITINYE